MVIISISKEEMQRILKEAEETDYKAILERCPQTRELIQKMKEKNR